MKRNLGSQGRTQGGMHARNTGERSGQTGFDSLDEQGIGTEEIDIHDDVTPKETPVEEIAKEIDEITRQEQRRKNEIH